MSAATARCEPGAGKTQHESVERENRELQSTPLKTTCTDTMTPPSRRADYSGVASLASLPWSSDLVGVDAKKAKGPEDRDQDA